MWTYLKKIYNQDNPTRRFQLELDMSEYSQGTMSIQEYYSGFINIWAEYKMLVYGNVLIEGLKTLQAVHEITQGDQFLMKLRHEYEPVRSNLLSRAPTPSLEICLSELLREEQRCLTQAALERKDIGSNPLDAAFTTQIRGKDGSRMVPNASYAAPAPSHSSTISSVITREVVQQIIQSVISAFCLTGKTTSSPIWYVHSGASNHMTFLSVRLSNIMPHAGNLQIQTANGEVVPIKSVGDIPHTLLLPNVLHTPLLASNLISAGQLVDDNCNVSFSKSGCIVQDQTSGKLYSIISNVA
ncbi:hypothetical protein RHSIM_Rhsim04G0131100 [Rhododendron simsii]|uniref:Retrovirus-related Pol polyprotein from transposon TNT 1-94-like beta-barrel domain-containing protein n=1 Tax=Rhododendron simsii TaxID=118357 RepID=A0A834H0F5_RHOSS|nr:hypothetical protein RHSIM_Rhsim04G0131100 [Rhododendron simsii]